MNKIIIVDIMIQRTSLNRIDVNADLGEGCPWDLPILAHVSSASLSCGFHAGDPDSIRATATAALERGVPLGAHPGYPDRAQFGRIPRTLSAAQVQTLILDQVHALDMLIQPLGAAIAFLKPHGALYNQAQTDPEIARGVLLAAHRLGPIPLLAMPRSILDAIAPELPNPPPLYGEGFIDRGYAPDGSLIPRGQPGATLEDPALIEDQLARLLADPQIATLCLHGDDPNALHNAGLVSRFLDRHHISLRGFLSE
jgi:UPF0271 protein